MAGFIVECKKCGWKQEFNQGDPNRSEDYYFEQDKKISIFASCFVSPPEITISCQNPECDNYV